jgi:hypothetical protein
MTPVPVVGHIWNSAFPSEDRKTNKEDCAMMTDFAAIIAAAARREHGCHARYTAGCRCLPCRAAHARYESRCAELRRIGKGNPVVSAEPARQHLRALSRHGVGYKTVAKVAHVAASVLLGIRRGCRKNCRAATERAVLAVDRTAVHGTTNIDAGPTWNLINKLLRDGYSKAQLAAWLGLKTPALQLHHERITAINAAKIRRMHDDVQAGRLSRPTAARQWRRSPDERS